jgi:Inhibitor of apoptosis-promoting Bax1
MLLARRWPHTRQPSETIFVQIPNGALIYAIVGLVIFAGLTAFDFQRLRRSHDIRTAPLLAASIFLDILNVFLLLLSLFGGSKDQMAFLRRLCDHPSRCPGSIGTPQTRAFHGRDRGRDPGRQTGVDSPGGTGNNRCPG